MFMQLLLSSITAVIILSFACFAIGQETPIDIKDEPAIEIPKEYFKVSEKVYLVDETAIDTGDMEKRIAQLDGMIAQAQAEKDSLLAEIKKLNTTAKDISTAVTAEKEKK